MAKTLLGRTWSRLERRFTADSEDGCCGPKIEEARFESDGSGSGGGTDRTAGTETGPDGTDDADGCCA